MKNYYDFRTDLPEGEFLIIKRKNLLEYVKYNSSTLFDNVYKEDNKLIAFTNESDARTFCREENEIIKERVMFKKILVLSISILLIILLVIGITTKYSIINKEIDLRETYLAKEKLVKSLYNSMTKILKDKKIIADTTADKDKEFMSLAMNAKYGDKDPLFLSISAADPKFNYELYKDLIRSIEQTRLSYTKEEEELLNIYSIYKRYVSKPFNSMFVDCKIEPYEPIVTESTKQTFESGIESETTF